MADKHGELPSERRNRRNQEQYDAYMTEVEDYLGKVQRGRSTKRAEPEQEAFNEETEKQRQLNMHRRASAYQRLMERQNVYRR